MGTFSDRLDAIAAEASRKPAWPSGASTDCFRWDGRREGKSIVFSHDGLRLRLTGFKAIDPKKWDEDSKHRYYSSTHPSGVGLLWCVADVDWAAGKLKGGSDGVTLGHSLDRSKALNGLTPNSPEWAAFEGLMCEVEKVVGAIYGDELTKEEGNGQAE